MTKLSGAIQKTCSFPCNLCGGQEVSVLANRSRSGQPLRTVICTQCGLVWSDPLPHNPRDFYEDEYRVNYKGTYSPKPKHILRVGQVALSRHRKIEPLLSRPLSILDVGSGGGEFSYLLKTLGHQVQGIEPNKGYADYSIREYELDVQIGFIQDNRFQKTSFDLITIWHVLEHTENPGDVLSLLHALSEDGGNITLMARKTPENRLDQCDIRIAGNSEKIIRTVRNHTPSKHYLSTHPYTRLLRRVGQVIHEKRGTAGFTGGKTLLDQLYLNEI